MRAALLLFTFAVGAFGTDRTLEQALDRVSEEAAVFRATASKILAREKLTQRAAKPPRRFRPRLGSAALEPPKPRYRTREVISDYTFSSFKTAPGVLHEFRQVISVDNRQVAGVEEARKSLATGMRSEDDRIKKRLLENFEKYGLSGVAADFGQILLLFTRNRLSDYSFEWAGEGQAGADRARIISFKQTGGAGSMVIFEPRKAVHMPLQGHIWVRASDSMPLRVVLASERVENKVTMRDEATVDYTMTSHGYLAPASVVHRELRGGMLAVENVYQYSDYRVFQADADIKFDSEPPAKK